MMNLFAIESVIDLNIKKKNWENIHKYNKNWQTVEFLKLINLKSTWVVSVPG